MIRAAHWPNSTESQPLVLKLRFMVLERLPRLILDPARGPAGLWAPDNACDTRAPADSTGVSLSCQAPQGLLSPLNADKESPFGLQIDTNCCNCCLVSKSCLTLATPWTVARHALLSMDFSRQEYWSGLPFLLQGIFRIQGLNPGLLHCR